MVTNVGVVVHSSVAGGAESYLTRLYGDPSDYVKATVFGCLPGWEGATHDLALSPKWGKRTILQGLLRLPSEQRRLASSVSDDPQDVYHLQFKREQLGFSQRLSESAPVIWTEHGRMTGQFMRTLGHWYQSAARYTSAITCVSREVAEDVRQVVGPKCRIEVIENAVDTTRFHPASSLERLEARTRFGVDAETPVLVWVGRLHPNKLPNIAVDVARQWPGHTLIAGTGPALEDLRRQASGNERISFLGHVDPTQVYAAADAFMLTSTGKGEGYPTTVLEASACGLSTVANVQSGTGRIVSELGGTMLPDHASVGTWVDALMETRSDQRSEAARSWALTHSVESWRARHMDLICDVTAG